MSVWYRVAITSDSAVAFSGEGGLFTAGRWNHLGRKAVYCSASIALGTLEWLAHNGLSIAAFNYYRYAIDIDDQLVAKFNADDLPVSWKLTPATDITRDFAEKKLFRSEKHLAMAVPSVMVPEEFNLVINPLHPFFPQALKTIKSLGESIALPHHRLKS